jgi:transposase-like protein
MGTGKGSRRRYTSEEKRKIAAGYLAITGDNFYTRRLEYCNRMGCSKTSADRWVKDLELHQQRKPKSKRNTSYYDDAFKRQAVEAYLAAPYGEKKAVAENLGCSVASMQIWVGEYATEEIERLRVKNVQLEQALASAPRHDSAAPEQTPSNYSQVEWLVRACRELGIGRDDMAALVYIAGATDDVEDPIEWILTLGKDANVKAAVLAALVKKRIADESAALGAARAIESGA